ncbi:transposase, partial [Agrobacterium vitis]|uniref:transposase n=1 Tax=Agrobacterium vitis TaxID=373 RepID=UPI001F258C4D
METFSHTQQASKYTQSNGAETALTTRRRFDLTDFEWTVIQPLLPNKPRGVPRVDDRRVINGILWRF